MWRGLGAGSQYCVYVLTIGSMDAQYRDNEECADREESPHRDLLYMFFGYKNPARLHTAEMRERQPDTYETGNAAIVAKRTILSIFTKKHIRLVGSMDTALTV